MIGLAGIVLIFALFLGAITYTSFVAASFEENAREEVEMILSEEEFAEYQLLEFEVVMDDDYPFVGPERVVVTIGGPAGESPPELADQIHEHINRHSDETVAVEIRYFETVER